MAKKREKERGVHGGPKIKMVTYIVHLLLAGPLNGRRREKKKRPNNHPA